MWITLAFVSAALLGIYDVAKKHALNHNAVIPVLFLNTLFCSLFFVPFILLSTFQPECLQGSLLYVPPLSFHGHLYILLKAAIVLTSWIFTYFALKHLPITLGGPIKATQPVMTLLGALLIYGEVLNLYQWIGVMLALFAFMLLSRSGRKEGIRFGSNRWIWCMMAGTMAGAASGLYDKYLMGHFDRMAVQSWYMFYQMVMMGGILLFLWYPTRRITTPFVWRKSIFFISLFLVLADFAYFYALSLPDAMISVISMTRRSGVVVSFVAGALLFKESNLRSKAIDVVLVLIGMFFLYLGSR